jgi:hypothetical protein
MIENLMHKHWHSLRGEDVKGIDSSLAQDRLDTERGGKPDGEVFVRRAGVRCFR